MRYFVISDDTDVRVGLRLAGVDGVLAPTAEDAMEAIDRALSDPTIGILLITHSLAAQCAGKLAPLRLSGRTPLVVEIPGRDGGRGEDSITRTITEAIGVKL